MTKRKLWQLLWRHYRTLLLTAGGVLLLVGIKEGYSIAHNPSRYVAQNVSSFALMEATHLRMETVVAIIVRTCLDTLTFDLILVKLDQKQEFLIHEKLCTPL
ncbi:hypothetical protein BWL06_06505 [Lactiplantibacillus plantarum]|uniref:hypothetical protein n=1 Tax=Lactiplantibacillus plantarum TaxID=1590 RepID=UPI0009C2C362|nr:hypothetical protein [Lactiplantibacillus plantarum]AQY70740.1 hypothetical protein BWL06_06505 [Lactiplantibacillus plantarum]MCW6173670.1 hypothetical protein [Lactiplantibacillus plantarum]